MEAPAGDSAAATASWTSAARQTTPGGSSSNRRSLYADSQQQDSPPDTSWVSKPTLVDEAHARISAPRVVYGAGKISCLPNELGRLGVSAPLIISSPSRIGLARKIQTLIPNLDSRILDSAVVNVPARVVDDALERIAGRDVVISIGGASAVGLAKAVGCRKGIPHICVPTTYSGSEMMPLLMDAYPARHSNAAKVGHGRDRGAGDREHTSPRMSSLRDPKVLPSVIIYDEELTSSIPKRFLAPSDASALFRATQFEECRSTKDDATAQWSYIHLPGV